MVLSYNQPYWQRLPTEILCMVLSAIPDLPTLSQLTLADGISHDIFHARYKLLFAEILQNSTPLQFAKIAAGILSIRHTHPFDQNVDIDHKKEPEEMLEAYLEGDTLACTISTMNSPHEALGDMVFLYSDIEYLTDTFVLTLCRQPGLRFSDTGTDIVLPTREKTPSLTELYRIRRALWRFWLLCELAYHDPDQTRPRRNAVNTYAVQSLVENMTLWELEELECVYFFLQQWYSTPQHKPDEGANPSRYTTVQEQPPIIQRLLLAMGYHHDALCPPVLDEDNTNLPRSRSLHFYAFTQGRAKLDHPQAPLTSWSDAPLAANTPSEGWLCYCRNSGDSPKGLGPSGSCPYRPSMIEFHKWAYCIWDRDRLEQWDMLDRARGRKGNWKVDVGRWYYGANEEELTKDERD